MIQLYERIRLLYMESREAEVVLFSNRTVSWFLEFIDDEGSYKAFSVDVITVEMFFL